jgi:DNA-binding NtrC family response regulator
MANSVIRILLVDDEHEIVDYLSKRLKKKGHQVEGAISGADALKILKDRIFDVAVLDLKMPQMDGIELLKRIKEEQPYLQAIMLTGHGSMDNALESGRNDALRFLVKPMDFDGLLEAIDEAYAQKRKEQAEAFKAELKALIAHSMGAPHELVYETERLRRQYEMED